MFFSCLPPNIFIILCLFAEVNTKNAKKHKNYCFFNVFMLSLTCKEVVYESI
nr:MAG TPA: hypothetical protein [Caudoviricetes sp.]